jgi:hypothetical protein
MPARVDPEDLTDLSRPEPEDASGVDNEDGTDDDDNHGGPGADQGRAAPLPGPWPSMCGASPARRRQLMYGVMLPKSRLFALLSD